MTLTQPSPRVAALLGKVRATRGRLIFALDATASRAPLWDLASSLTASMFEEAAKIGGLDLQVLAYGGHDEFRTSAWDCNAGALIGWMQAINCKSGATQIERVLQHIQRENTREKVAVAVLISDACEERPEELYAATAGLPPLFMFQEGNGWAVPPDHMTRYASGASPLLVEQVFRELARRTGGAYCRFDSGAARQLGELLRAAAAFASGGLKALTQQNSEGARLLLTQMKRGARS